MNKPNLTDIKLVTFFTDMNKNIHVKEDIKPTISYNNKNNINIFFINLIFILIIIIFIYILYRRNKLKNCGSLFRQNVFYLGHQKFETSKCI